MKGCSMSTIEWEYFDLKDNFSVFDAACLWVEIEPTKTIEKDMPVKVRTMIDIIEKHTEGTHQPKLGDVFGPKPVSRSDLIKLAEHLDKKPKFLFPESRKEKPVEKSLSTRERETLLKLIIGMAVHGYSYDPSLSRNDKHAEIAEDLEKSGIPLDTDTVRKWLQQAAILLPSKS